MRVDGLAQRLDEHRHPVTSMSADEMWRLGHQPVSGADLAARFGLLAHYTTTPNLARILQYGHLGPGCWLTPTAYMGCVSPYRLGLASPRDVCLLIDVANFGDIWGPGVTIASRMFPTIWRGGGIEFYYPQSIPIAALRDTIALDTCGDANV